MGRRSTGATTVESSQRLELSYLMKQGFISKGKILSGTLSWNNGNTIKIISEFTSDRQYIRLIYKVKKYSGEYLDLDYYINLESIPSNLGKGKIWYFVCPINYKRSRILYQAYGSNYFKSREAFQNRIYYSSQICSKSYFPFERCHSIAKTLCKVKPLGRKKTYQGKETRLQQRIRKLEYRKTMLDLQSLYLMDKMFQRMKRSNQVY